MHTVVTVVTVVTMRRVYKLPISLNDHSEFVLPISARILTIQLQHGVPTMWYDFEDGDETVKTVRIRCAGTGHPIKGRTMPYFGTVQLNDGDLVLHYFVEEPQ